MKHALATTSVVALLLAGPALAQAPANPSGSATPTTGATTSPGNGAAAGGPDITVKQPPPVVTVQPHAPDVKVQQYPPSIAVEQGKPDVSVQTGQPTVKVAPPGKPNVAVESQGGAPSAGSTTAPNGQTGAPAAAAVAPAAGTYPMAAEAEKWIGKDVYGPNGKEIGEINNLLVGPDGRVHAAVVEFGGFLGIGEDKVAIPWDQMHFSENRATVNMTEDQIKAEPRWSKTKPGQFAEYHPYR